MGHRDVVRQFSTTQFICNSNSIVNRRMLFNTIFSKFDYVMFMFRI